MAARAAQLAFLIDQLVPALRTKPPVLAGNVLVRWRGARLTESWRFSLLLT
jgi:hypothetical protein